MRTKFLSLIAGILLASILSGCGGSSSSGQSVSTGVYKDAGIVSGLQYATPTQSGVTDSNGKFKYVAGETVTFSVSNVTIGQATGAPIVTTFDLVGITPPTSSFGIPTNNPTSKKFQEAINISLFLQTLDDDSDPTNGIAIPAVVNTVVAATPINFKLTRNSNTIFVYQTWSNFRDSPQFKVFIGSCRTAGAWGGTKAIKQLGYAANSLYQGLGIVPSVYLNSSTLLSDGSFDKYEYTSSGLVSKRTYFENSESPYLISTKNYDKNGSLVSSIDVLPSTSESDIENFFYDANGNPIRTTVKFSNLAEYEIDSEYDINGNITSKVFILNGSVVSRAVYKYNANGTLALSLDYNGNGDLLYSTNYTYNTNLYPISVTDSTTQTLLEYDANNNLIKVTNKFPDSISTTTISYDVNDNILNVSNYDGSLLYYKSIYNWNSAGYLASIDNFVSNDQLYSSALATYDENGNRIRAVVEIDGATITTTSTFIKQSGWGDIITTLTSFFGSRS